MAQTDYRKRIAVARRTARKTATAVDLPQFAQAVQVVLSQLPKAETKAARLALVQVALAGEALLEHEVEASRSLLLSALATVNNEVFCRLLPVFAHSFFPAECAQMSKAFKAVKTSLGGGQLGIGIGGKSPVKVFQVNSVADVIAMLTGSDAASDAPGPKKKSVIPVTPGDPRNN